jgi:hypothetical protein
MNIKVCRTCGEMNTGTRRYCIACGESLADVSPSGGAAAGAPEPEDTRPVEPTVVSGSGLARRGRWWKWPLVIAIGAVLVGLVYVLVRILGPASLSRVVVQQTDLPSEFVLESTLQDADVFRSDMPAEALEVLGARLVGAYYAEYVSDAPFQRVGSLVTQWRSPGDSLVEYNANVRSIQLDKLSAADDVEVGYQGSAGIGDGSFAIESTLAGGAADLTTVRVFWRYEAWFCEVTLIAVGDPLADAFELARTVQSRVEALE